MTAATADLILPVPSKCPYPEVNEKNTTTNIAHESDCTKFYKCKVGQRLEQQCPFAFSNQRLHYNRFEQVCDWPWRAGCEICPDAEDEQGRALPDSKIARSGSCRNYYQCRKGVAVSEGKCTSDTCFSRTCQKCVKNREGGSCDDDEDSSGEISTITPPCRTGERSAHDCNCNMYYECFNDEDLSPGCCDSGLHFSPTERICLPADVAGCYRLSKNIK